MGFIVGIPAGSRVFPRDPAIFRGIQRDPAGCQLGTPRDPTNKDMYINYIIGLLDGFPWEVQWDAAGSHVECHGPVASPDIPGANQRDPRWYPADPAASHQGSAKINHDFVATVFQLVRFVSLV